VRHTREVAPLDHRRKSRKASHARHADADRRKNFCATGWLSEMIGNEFEVEEIDEAGQAWVTMWWNSEDTERWMVTESGWLPLRWNSSYPAGRKTRTRRLINSKSPINQCITMCEWRSSQ
jgi:hypothetical protein